jgi:hypothetical protein
MRMKIRNGVFYKGLEGVVWYGDGMGCFIRGWKGLFGMRMKWSVL